MGILLIIIVLILVIWALVVFFDVTGYAPRIMRESIKKSAFAAGVIIVVALSIYSMFAIVFIINSYDSYLDTRAYYDNLIAQYKGAITLYEDKAVALDMEKAVKHALTDLRFQGYQEKMGDFVLDLRKAVTRYNSTIIRKRVLDKNFFYGWYVTPPDDDMKTIDIMSK